MHSAAECPQGDATAVAPDGPRTPSDHTLARTRLPPLRPAGGRRVPHTMGPRPRPPLPALARRDRPSTPENRLTPIGASVYRTVPKSDRAQKGTMSAARREGGSGAERGGLSAGGTANTSRRDVPHPFARTRSGVTLAGTLLLALRSLLLWGITLGLCLRPLWGPAPGRLRDVILLQRPGSRRGHHHLRGSRR